MLYNILYILYAVHVWPFCTIRWLVDFVVGFVPSWFLYFRFVSFFSLSLEILCVPFYREKNIIVCFKTGFFIFLSFFLTLSRFGRFGTSTIVLFVIKRIGFRDGCLLMCMIRFDIQTLKRTTATTMALTANPPSHQKWARKKKAKNVKWMQRLKLNGCLFCLVLKLNALASISPPYRFAFAFRYLNFFSLRRFYCVLQVFARTLARYRFAWWMQKSTNSDIIALRRRGAVTGGFNHWKCVRVSSMVYVCVWTGERGAARDGDPEYECVYMFCRFVC